MRFTKKQQLYFSFSLLVLAGAIGLTVEMGFNVTPENIMVLEQNVLSLIIFMGSFFLGSVLLLLSKRASVKSWYVQVLSWFVPLSIILIASGNTSSSYAWLPRASLALLCGQALVVITVLFVLVHHFWLQKR